eukprot:353077-Chlamydomonas_euryale.AAC.19
MHLHRTPVPMLARQKYAVAAVPRAAPRSTRAEDPAYGLCAFLSFPHLAVVELAEAEPSRVVIPHTHPAWRQGLQNWLRGLMVIGCATIARGHGECYGSIRGSRVLGSSLQWAHASTPITPLPPPPPPLPPLPPPLLHQAPEPVSVGRKGAVAMPPFRSMPAPRTAGVPLHLPIDSDSDGRAFSPGVHARCDGPPSECRTESSFVESFSSSSVRVRSTSRSDDGAAAATGAAAVGWRSEAAGGEVRMTAAGAAGGAAATAAALPLPPLPPAMRTLACSVSSLHDAAMVRGCGW